MLMRIVRAFLAIGCDIGQFRLSNIPLSLYAYVVIPSDQFQIFDRGKLAGFEDVWLSHGISHQMFTG